MYIYIQSSNNEILTKLKSQLMRSTLTHQFLQQMKKIG